jgi:hypothetical protein
MPRRSGAGWTSLSSCTAGEILDPANLQIRKPPFRSLRDPCFVAAALNLRGCCVPRVALFYDGKFDL